EGEARGAAARDGAPRARALAHTRARRHADGGGAVSRRAHREHPLAPARGAARGEPALRAPERARRARGRHHRRRARVPDRARRGRAARRLDQPRGPPDALSVAPGDELELAIQALAAGGDGVARTDGLAVFVPLAAPGDRVRARVTQVRARFARAEIVELLSPGPGRRSAPCPYYGRCGGCTWQHLDESAQLAARGAIARAALERIAHRTALPQL